MTEQFDLVRSIYTSCASTAFMFGMLFNVFLVWLILTKTPAPMLVYSKLLMTPALMDIFLALFTFLVQPIPIVDHGYHAVIQNGFFRQMSELYNYTANVIWFQVLLLSVCTTTCQFVFRYYMIINDGIVPAKLKYITGTVLTLLLIAHVLLHYLSDYPFSEYAPQMAQLAKWVHEEIGITDIRFSSFTPARNYIWMLHCAAMLIIFGICYVIIVYCARGTCNYIAKAYANASVGEAPAPDVKKNAKLREYNNQITTAMIVQAILPTVEVIELSIQTTLPIFAPNGGTIYYMVYAAIPLYFIPVMNPLATMLFVKPYRMAIMRMLGKKFRVFAGAVTHSSNHVQNLQAKERSGTACRTATTELRQPTNGKQQNGAGANEKESSGDSANYHDMMI